jgi:hypothetical protein
MTRTRQEQGSDEDDSKRVIMTDDGCKDDGCKNDRCGDRVKEGGVKGERVKERAICESRGQIQRHETYRQRASEEFLELHEGAVALMCVYNSVLSLS